MGVVGAVISTSATSKMLAMWMPIMLFFYMEFEHSIVNMFLFPFSMIMGGGFTIADYLIWNELPTILGNLVGGLLFVGLPLYYTYIKKSPVIKKFYWGRWKLSVASDPCIFSLIFMYYFNLLQVHPQPSCFCTNSVALSRQ